jgi:hypothetical protein
MYFTLYLVSNLENVELILLCNDLDLTQTCSLPVCSIVPQPTFFNCLNSPVALRPWCWLRASNINQYHETSWGVKRDQHIRMTASLPSVSQLSRERWILSISNPIGLQGFPQGWLYFFIALWYECAMLIPSRKTSSCWFWGTVDCQHCFIDSLCFFNLLLLRLM